MNTNLTFEQAKKLWTDALRSGEYAQTRGYLHTVSSALSSPEGYCYLGVLCKVLNIPETITNSYKLIHGDFENCGTVTTSDEINKFMHLNDFVESGKCEKYFYLTNMNDDGVSFDQIADWIESNVVSE